MLLKEFVIKQVLKVGYFCHPLSLPWAAKTKLCEWRSVLGKNANELEKYQYLKIFQMPLCPSWLEQNWEDHMTSRLLFKRLMKVEFTSCPQWDSLKQLVILIKPIKKIISVQFSFTIHPENSEKEGGFLLFSGIVEKKHLPEVLNFK